MRTSIPQESKDSSSAGGSVRAQRETVFKKNKSVRAMADNKIMVVLRTFQPTFVMKALASRIFPAF